MHSISRITLLAHILLLAGNVGAAGAGAIGVQRRAPINIPSKDSHERRMIAARSSSTMERRNLDAAGLLKYEHTLPFIDDDKSASAIEGLGQPLQAPFAANVQLKSSLPTLLLEDHDGFLETISCHGSSMELDFFDPATLSRAWAEIQKHTQMLVITSHAGCNADGEREPYLVTNVEKTAQSLFLTITPTTFKKSFHSIDVSFGSKIGDEYTRRDQGLKKRQAASTSSVAPTATQITGATVATAYAGTTILPPSFPGSDLIVPDLPAGLTVVCKNCSLQGRIDISDGVIGTDSSSSSSDSLGDFFEADIDETINFFDGGYVDLTVNDLTAHIELETTAQPTGTLVEHTVEFPDIGIPGLVIPKIASIGPVLRPQIVFGIALSTTLEFTYGFDISLPTAQRVHLDLADPTSLSTVSGFQSTQITPLPFESSASPTNVTLSIAFQPLFLLTFSLLAEPDAALEAGAFFDIPRLSVTFSEADQCPAPTLSSPAPFPTTTASSSTAGSGGNFINIIPEVELDAGVLVNADLAVSARSFSLNEGVSRTLASTSFPLPTTCLSFDGQEKSYVAVETGTITGTSTGVGMGGAGSATGTAGKGTTYGSGGLPPGATGSPIAYVPGSGAARGATQDVWLATLVGILGLVGGMAGMVVI